MRHKRKVEHATSVKDINISVEPRPDRFGVADFTAKPVFSVFDYGTIVPPVPLDNSTITLMGGFNFEKGVGWDYSMFGKSDLTCYVQPIEFISRNSLPASSSVWKRVERKEITLQDLGLPAAFKQGDEIPKHLKPILDYSTKFEPEDRYLSPQQAQRLMGMSDSDFARINETTRKASNLMTV